LGAAARPGRSTVVAGRSRRERSTGQFVTVCRGAGFTARARHPHIEPSPSASARAPATPPMTIGGDRRLRGLETTRAATFADTAAHTGKITGGATGHGPPFTCRPCHRVHGSAGLPRPDEAITPIKEGLSPRARRRSRSGFSPGPKTASHGASVFFFFLRLVQKRPTGGEDALRAVLSVGEASVSVPGRPTHRSTCKYTRPRDRVDPTAKRAFIGRPRTPKARVRRWT